MPDTRCQITGARSVAPNPSPIVVEDKFWIVDLITRFTIHDAGGKRTEHRIQTSNSRRQKSEAKGVM